MRVFFFILEKEFRQVFRNPAILRMIFIMPSVQLLLMPLAADYEVKHINVAVVDQDRSSYSRRLTEKIEVSPYFSLTNYETSYFDALDKVTEDKADLILQIPVGFEGTLIREDVAELFLAINAINGVKANLGGAYLRQVIADFNNDVRQEWMVIPRMNSIPLIQVKPVNWFNPAMNYKFFMVPGILVILLTMVGGFLSALNVVKEKEMGTIEQINVTPIGKAEFILGKLTPFWVLGLIILTIGLLISWVAYGIVPVGSIFTIYAFAGVYLVAILGLGLFVSTISHTQQQAMLISFFLMMLFILLGGLYTSIDSMPLWAQTFAKVNPVTYFIQVMRLIILKGSGFTDIWKHFLSVLAFGVFMNALAVWNYRKRS